MTPALLVTLLGWVCFAGAILAFLIYILHFASRQGWRRPWNAAGLVFISVALSQTPSLFDYIRDQRGLRTAAIVTFCLLAAAAVQSLTALRQRRAGDRGNEPETAPGGPTA